MKPEIHDFIQAELGSFEFRAVTKGATNAELFKITLPDEQNYYLKILFTSNEQTTLLRDKNMYDWLANKADVPEVVFYKQTNRFEALCMTEIKGITLAELMGKAPAETIVKLYAKALKDLHAIAIANCGLIRTLESKLQQAAFNLKNNLVAYDDLEEENENYDLNRLLETLLREIPAECELVFTHGDFCPDNIIVTDNHLPGYIDMGGGGVADKYQDLALAVRSIQHDLGNEWVDLFFKEYGLPEPNLKKLNFYRQLDEFF